MCGQKREVRLMTVISAYIYLDLNVIITNYIKQLLVRPTVLLKQFLLIFFKALIKSVALIYRTEYSIGEKVRGKCPDTL